MATILNTTQTYSAADVVTHTNLNNIVGGAAFVAGDGGSTDNTSLEVDTTSGSLQIKNNGVTSDKIIDDAITFDKIAQSVLDKIYPVGSVYSNADDNTNPSTLLGFGSWNAFGAGEVMVGIDATDSDFDIVGSGTNTNGTTGAKTHTLTESELAQHHHLAVVDGTVTETGNVTASNAISENATQTGSTFQSYRMRPATSETFGTVGRTSQVGSDSAHNNLQPYVVVYMWKRIS
jgi:hypothetical protein